MTTPNPGVRPRPWRRHSRLNWAVGTTVVAALSVGAIATPVAAGASTHHKPIAATHPKKKPPKKAAPGIGASFRVLNQDKQYESVKLVAVMDPAQGADQFTTPDPGKRFVAVELSITNQSSGTDSNDANDNTSVVGSNKQVYSSDVSSVAECTNFDDGLYTLSKGENEVGCVTFQLPTGVSVAKIQYNPNAGFSTNNAQWTLAPPG